MPIIRIDQAAQDSMKAAAIEEYLVGSGKPPGAKVTINGEEVSWGDDAPPVVKEHAKVANYRKMNKQQIEEHVRDNYGVELDRRHSKAELIVQALRARLDSEG